MNWDKIPPWMAGIIFLLAIVFGGIPSSMFRIDKFGATEAKEMESRILKHIDYKLTLLEHRMPPMNTRLRIELVEDFLEEQFSKEHAKHHAEGNLDHHTNVEVFEPIYKKWGQR